MHGRFSRLMRALLGGVLSLSLISCASNTVRYGNDSGRASVYEDVQSVSTTAGVGLESNDIVSMTDQMMRSMMSNSTLMNQSTPPRVVIEGAGFTNESLSRVNLNLLTERLRIQLNRAANGRLIFVSRQNADRVNKERELKRAGVVDGGTIRKTALTFGVDFELTGKIMSQDSMVQDSQQKTRYTMISFEMLDMESMSIVWGDMYEFRKTAQDDIIYR